MVVWDRLNRRLQRSSSLTNLDVTHQWAYGEPNHLPARYAGSTVSVFQILKMRSQGLSESSSLLETPAA